MINHIYARQYCKNYEQIENYQEAVNSPEMWDCHHRLEETGLSKKDLIDKDMYYNRPANELIFLTHRTHVSLHKKGNKYRLGAIHSIETRKKMSDSMKGNKNNLDKHLSTETKKKISDARRKFICPIKLTYMYCKQKMSAYVIAKEFGVDRNVIIRRLRELNIPIRKR